MNAVTPISTSVSVTHPRSGGKTWYTTVDVYLTQAAAIAAMSEDYDNPEVAYVHDEHGWADSDEVCRCDGCNREYLHPQSLTDTGMERLCTYCAGEVAQEPSPHELLSEFLARQGVRQ